MHRSIAAAGALLTVAALTTACGGSDSATSVPTRSATSGTTSGTTSAASPDDASATSTAGLILRSARGLPLSDSRSSCVEPSVYRHGVWYVGQQISATTDVAITGLPVSVSGAVVPDHAVVLHVAQVDPSLELSTRSLARYLPAGVWAHRSPLAQGASLKAPEHATLAYHLALRNGQSFHLETVGVAYTASGTTQVARSHGGADVIKVDSSC